MKFYAMWANHTLTALGLAIVSWTFAGLLYAETIGPHVVLPVKACVIERDLPLTTVSRAHIASCLGWQSDAATLLCHGAYQYDVTNSFSDEGQIQIMADSVSLYPHGRSSLNGHVDIRETARIVNANTAYIYRDEKTNEVTRIELLGEVQYREPDRYMIAKKAVINPNNKSGQVEHALYRFNTNRMSALLPAWGRAGFVERFENQNYLMRQATYTTCAPKDNAWQIEADEITLNQQESKGVARHALLRIKDWPLLYTPYLSFPTSKQRKSGFLMPVSGYSNVGGVDLALPYYWNIAPNYDATITPHAYSLRGLMMGGDARFLTEHSMGFVRGSILPKDQAFHHFIDENQIRYPALRGTSDNRWSFLVHESTAFTNQLHMNIHYSQVSDDYYLQDFSSNLAISTENQLLRQGDLTYTTDHWLFRGMLQSYQTLHPINQSAISNIYERLPQLLAQSSYADLPMDATLSFLGEFDNYRWHGDHAMQPEGPRYHVNPVLSFPHLKPWGYFTPSAELVENYYDTHYLGGMPPQTFNRTIPRYSFDSGLTFERSSKLLGDAYTQTLEPRLYYLYVPFHDQSSVPVYDSAYMIFNTDQLFRTNRFSGFDRIGDTNQLSYAITSRWLSEETGREQASFTIGQIRYFSKRQVALCYQNGGGCVDNSLMLGYLSPEALSSPIASKASYQLNSFWGVSGDYIYNVDTRATNNGNLNLHYQPATNHLITFGYSYLVNGNVLNVPNEIIQNNALHQATIGYAWPLTEQWRGLGAYSYNISKHYDMMTFVGLEYDSCCWAMRLMGGRTFKSLSPTTLLPQYNNNVYVQILLKGLGSVANTDPATTIATYLPGYRNMF